METINVKKAINSRLATSGDKGNILFSLLKDRVVNKQKVLLDFSEIKTVIPSFTNKAIGKLFDYITLEDYHNLIFYNEDITQTIKDTINYSIENSTTKRALKNGVDRKMYEEIESENNDIPKSNL